MLPDVIRQMPDSKSGIAQVDSPYIDRVFIKDKLWVEKIKLACPTQISACLLL